VRGVAALEAQVREAALGGQQAPGLEHRLGQVERDDLGRVRRERRGGVSGAAAEVEQALAARERGGREHGVEVRSAAVHRGDGVGRGCAAEALLDAGLDRVARRHGGPPRAGRDRPALCLLEANY
jgi:hypothetical protein